MMRSRATIGHGLGWLLCGSVCLTAPLGLACTVEDVPELEELEEDEEDLEFRAGGCGAQQQKGTVSQTCKYTPNPAILSTVGGTCIDDDQIECEFQIECKWDAKATTAPTCQSQEPACAAKAIEYPKYKVVHNLSSGDKTCDPNDKTAEQRAQVCTSIYVTHAGSNKINDKTVAEILKAECRAQTKPDEVQDVECCVAKPQGGGSSGGESGAYEDDTGWTTSGDCSSAGESSDGSDDSGAGECPPGSTLQCTGGGDGPLACTCVMAEPLPLPLP